MFSGGIESRSRPFGRSSRMSEKGRFASFKKGLMSKKFAVSKALFWRGHGGEQWRKTMESHGH